MYYLFPLLKYALQESKDLICFVLVAVTLVARTVPDPELCSIIIPVAKNKGIERGQNLFRVTELFSGAVWILTQNCLNPKALSTLGSYRGKGDDKATAFRKMPTGGERPPKRGTKLHFMVIFTFAPCHTYTSHKRTKKPGNGQNSLSGDFEKRVVSSAGWNPKRFHDSCNVAGELRKLACGLFC